MAGPAARPPPTAPRAGRPARAVDAVMAGDGIVEAVLGLEAVAEALHQDPVGALIRPGLDRSLAQHVGPHVVDAVDLVGMLVRPQHGVDALDLGVQKLVAQVGRGIDQEGLAAVLHQDGAAAAAIARVGGVGRAPFAASAPAPYPSYATPPPAAQDRPPHRRRSALANSRKKLSVVAASSSATPTPLSSATLAAVWATKAGSLVLPRVGTGARYGASVSTSRRSSGMSRTTARRLSAALKV